MRRRDDVLATLREMIVNGVHFGRIAPGDRLPSARRMAKQLKADARVIRSAYESLERDGVVARRTGARGYFAALGTGRPGRPVPASEWIVSVISDAIERGISVRQFLDHARHSLDVVHSRTVCLECNDDHLTWLCGELEDDYGFMSRAINTRSSHDIMADPELERSDIIVTTSAHALLANSIGERLGKPVVLVTLRPDMVAEMTRLLDRGLVYFLCTDPHFEVKVRQLYSGVGNLDNIRTVLVGRDNPDSIPDGAPVWVMRRARERLGRIPPQIQPLNTARLFSPDTRTELLAHLVRANLAAASATQVRVQ